MKSCWIESKALIARKHYFKDDESLKTSFLIL